MKLTVRLTCDRADSLSARSVAMSAALTFNPYTSGLVRSVIKLMVTRNSGARVARRVWSALVAWSDWRPSRVDLTNYL